MVYLDRSRKHMGWNGHDSLQRGSNNTPWKGRLRSSNIVHGSFQTSFRNSHVDGELNDLDNNVDEESKVPSIVTHKAQMAKKALKTFHNNIGVQRSTQVK